MRRSVDGPAGRLKATDAAAIRFLTGLEGPATIESLEIRETSEPRKKASDGEGRQSREGRSGHSAEDPPAVLGRAARSRPVQLMRPGTGRLGAQHVRRMFDVSIPDHAKCECERNLVGN